MATGWSFKGARSWRVLGAALACALTAWAVGAAGAHAATTKRVGHTSRLAYHVGSFSGQMQQVSPSAFTGSISFEVNRGMITGLSFTAQTMCDTLSAQLQDSLPQLQVRVSRTGFFSYTGIDDGRTITLVGRVGRHTAEGTFFESFPWGQLNCSMDRAASFTVAR